MATQIKEPLKAYRSLGEPIHIHPVEIGLINKTYLITTDKLKFIFQKLSPLFNQSVNFDSDAIAKHLEKKSILCPKIYPNDFGELFLNHEGSIFRALFYIEGQSFNVCKPEMAESAGRVVGQFHQSLLDFDYTYRSTRKSASDYSYHLENLVQALKKHEQHDFFKQVAPLAEKMIRSMESIKIEAPKFLRHIHGDPKISNLMFKAHEAICLVDFDTLQKNSWSFELADAFRSWCNPFKEDELKAFADLSIADSALKGYAQVMKGQFDVFESENLAVHCQAVSLCLSMRYLADVLNENYFNFDEKRFARSSEHNWLRAQAMFNLYQDFYAKKDELLSMIKGHLL